MPNLGPAEILLILVVALVLFGPAKLPELGRTLGKGIREFRRGTQGLKEELEGSLKEDAAPAKPAATAQAQAPAQAATGPQTVQTQPAAQTVIRAAAPAPAEAPAPMPEPTPQPVSAASMAVGEADGVPRTEGRGQRAEG